MTKIIGRRSLIVSGSTMATALLIENLLLGCKVGTGNSAHSDAVTPHTTGPVTPPELFPLLTGAPLLVLRDKIADNPDSFPDIGILTPAAAAPEEGVARVFLRYCCNLIMPSI